jgi:hypothetical protein
MVKAKSKKEKKEINDYIEEQMGLLEESFEPSIKKSLEHIVKKFELENVKFVFRIDWKIKVNHNK